MNARPIALALLAALALDVHAGCKELAGAVDAALKEAADIEVRGMLEPTEQAPLKALRSQRVANQLATVNANLMLMDRAKCAMPQEPVGTGDLNPYITAASQCARPGSDAGACRRETWVRAR
jgi:hypothetical protein